MFDKRITLFMGHYGSGKTFVSVNYALRVKELGKKVSIYDLDVVNPYFRTVDARERLEKGGVNLVVSPYAETNVDIPAINAASYRMFGDRNEYAVIDIGGDDRGALALGRFSGKIKEENDYDALLVLNMFRPETRDLNGAICVIEEIERAGRLPFTGIVSNSNLGEDTTEKNILDGLEFAEKLFEKTKLPIVFTAVKRDLIKGEIAKLTNVLPVDPIKYGNWY